jgi:hypothetical protein
MSAKHLFAGVLLTAAIGVAPVLAQPMTPPGAYSPVVPTIPPPGAAAAVPPPFPAAVIADPGAGVQPVSPSASDWLKSPCLCNGPTGKNGPIGSELFLLTGPSIPVGNSVQDRFADTGWMVEIGARSLFFNPEGDKAWTVMLGLSYQYNNGSGVPAPFNYFNSPELPVTIREIHRYAFNFGGGRDWFLFGNSPLGCDGANLRFGFETGGRWGGQHVNMNLIINNPLVTSVDPRGTFLERYKVYGGYYLAAHIDMEVPMGSWVWFGGFRAEWALDFGNVIPFQNNTGQDINLLLSTGFRY